MEAFIYDAVRTPRGRGKPNGKLHPARPVDLASTVLGALRTRLGLDTSLVDDVIFGCVTPVGEQGAVIAKLAAQYSGYGDTVAGVQLNRFCASGLEAVNTAAAHCSAGYSDLVVAGGVESMSRVPMGSDGGVWMSDPEVAARVRFVPQGISADLLATLGGFTRADADAFALESQKRAARAVAEKRFARSLIPVRDLQGNILLETDEHPRPATTIAELGALKPSFAEMGAKYGFDAVALSRYPQVKSIDHVHHAGNSSGVVDGAAAVLIGTAAAGKRIGRNPRARIVSAALLSTEPTLMLAGPAPATKKCLAKAGVHANDVDLFEINEAFAAVVLHAIRELEVDPAKVNVNGGAIALGHPLGATGAILIGTALDELERTGKRYALVTLCVGGGMGIATLIERL